MVRRCTAKTAAGTQCKKKPRTGKNICGVHDNSVDRNLVGDGKKGGIRTGDLWARLKRAEKRYPLRTWEQTISWLNGEIVLAREAIEMAAQGKDPAEQAKVLLGGTKLVQQWAKLLIESLKNYDEHEKGAIQVVFNLEHRPPEPAR